MDASTEPPSARLKHSIASAYPRYRTNRDPRQSGVIFGRNTTLGELKHLCLGGSPTVAPYRPSSLEQLLSA
jgi:hypothetical protein